MIELGLQRISRLLSTTALPWKAIHIAGTNGKGTVCHLTSALLNAYNRSQYRKNRHQPPIKHGRFTSPHLVDRWDCIAFNDPDSNSMHIVSASAFRREETAVQTFNAHHRINASEFELLTATAFRLFTANSLDVAVVEVGLGGRLDATNLLGEPVSGSTETKLVRQRFNPAKWRPKPLVTAITQIGLDHQAFLGNTRLEIATQKAGIMKPHVPVTWARDAELDACFEAKANELAAPVVRWEDLPLATTRPWQEQTQTARRVNGELAIMSAWTALAGLDRVSAPAAARAEAQDDHLLAELVAAWQEIVEGHVLPGRQESLSLERLTGKPREILLDGAHNEDGIALLASAVQTSLRDTPTPGQKPKPITWVLALSSSIDRDPAKILHRLLQPGDRVLAVEFGAVDGMPWVTAKFSAEIVQAAESVLQGIEARDMGKDLRSALIEACELAERDGGEVVVCGSLYLAGDVHRLLRGQDKEK